MTWRLRRQEPSFSSMNEKSFESRRVRTQPCTSIKSIDAVPCKASLIAVGETGLFIHFEADDQRSILNAPSQGYDAAGTQHSRLNCSHLALRNAPLECLTRACRAAREVGGYKTQLTSTQLRVHFAKKSFDLTVALLWSASETTDHRAVDPTADRSAAAQVSMARTTAS